MYVYLYICIYTRSALLVRNSLIGKGRQEAINKMYVNIRMQIYIFCLYTYICIIYIKEAQHLRVGTSSTRTGSKDFMNMRANINVCKHMCMFAYVYMHMYANICIADMQSEWACVLCICVVHVCYGLATISRLLKIVGLFCKRAQQKRLVFSKETYDFKEPTHRSHPIYICVQQNICVTDMQSEWACLTRSTHMPLYMSHSLYTSWDIYILLYTCVPYMCTHIATHIRRYTHMWDMCSDISLYTSWDMWDM